MRRKQAATGHGYKHRQLHCLQRATQGKQQGGQQCSLPPHWWALKHHMMHRHASQPQAGQQCSLPWQWCHSFYSAAPSCEPTAKRAAMQPATALRAQLSLRCSVRRAICAAQRTLSGLPMSLTAVYLEEEGDEMLTNTFSFTFLHSKSTLRSQ